MKTHWLLLLCALGRAGIWAIDEVLHECSVLAGKGERRDRSEDVRYEKLNKQLPPLLGPSGLTRFQRNEYEKDSRKMRSLIRKMEEGLGYQAAESETQPEGGETECPMS